MMAVEEIKMDQETFGLVGIKAQGFGNLELVDVKFDGKKFVVVEGPNGAGKTTFIEALFAAIKGVKHFKTGLGRSYPVYTLIKKEADKALISVKLQSSKRTVEVKRSITKHADGSTGGSLIIQASDDEKLDQAFLDRLIEDFTVDPAAFADMAPKDQMDVVRRLVGVDVDKVEKKVSELEAARLAAGRDRDRCKAKLTEEPPHHTETPISELLEKLRGIEEFNADVRKKTDARDGLLENYEQLSHDVIELEGKLQSAREQVAELERAIEDLPALPELEDTSPVETAIANAETNNALARAWDAWKANHDEYIKAQNEWSKYNAAITAQREAVTKAITEAKLPFNAVELSETAGLMIGGVPFYRLSDAEKIRIGAQIAMRMAPLLKVLTVRNGSLIDAEGMAIIRKIADDNGYQILVERVADDISTGPDKIVLRAGRLVSAFESKEAPASGADLL